jgi:hypothetical protein
VTWGKLKWCFIWQFDGCIDRANRRHWVDKPGAWGSGVNSELLLLTVEVCKVDTDSVSVAQDSGCVVRAGGPGRCRTGGLGCRGLHSNLMLLSWVLDQTSALVLL